MGFSLRAGDANVLSHLLYALRDLTTILRIRFDLNGLEIQQTVSGDEILLSCVLRADKCRFYSCDKNGSISVSPDSLYTVLSRSAQRDEIQLEYTDKDQYFHITIVKDDNRDIEQISKFELKILNDTEKFFELEAVSKCFDFVVAIDSSLLYSSFFNLVNLGSSKVIRVSCSKERLEMACTLDDVISYGRFKFMFSPEEKNSKRLVEDVTDTCNRKALKTKEKVDLLISSTHLGQLLKTFNISKTTIVMYISEQFPVVFETKIGLLGTLKVTVLPVFETQDITIGAY
jgi:hypothetical protein